MKSEKNLELSVGTRIEFKTQYGSYPGQYEGVIVHRMFANPGGFFPDGDPHYEVKVFIPPQNGFEFSPPKNVDHLSPDEQASIKRVGKMSTQIVGGFTVFIIVKPDMILQILGEKMS